MKHRTKSFLAWTKVRAAMTPGETMSFLDLLNRCRAIHPAFGESTLRSFLAGDKAVEHLARNRYRVSEAVAVYKDHPRLFESAPEPQGVADGIVLILRELAALRLEVQALRGV